MSREFNSHVIVGYAIPEKEIEKLSTQNGDETTYIVAGQECSCYEEIAHAVWKFCGEGVSYLTTEGVTLYNGGTGEECSDEIILFCLDFGTEVETYDFVRLHVSVAELSSDKTKARLIALREVLHTCGIEVGEAGIYHIEYWS